MIEYLAKTEIHGAEIRLIESQFGFCVIYGMQVTTFKKSGVYGAWKEYLHSVDHAIACN